MFSSMATGGIQGQLLDITVVGCNRLRDTEWISRQDPYVCLEYANNKFRTKTCTDGGKSPNFNEKFVLPLIEGLREVNVSVWNSNTLSFDDLIGTGKILLQRVLSSGYDDSTWPLNTRSGKNAGEVRIILHFANVGKNKVQSAASAPPYTGQFPTSAPYAPPGAPYAPPSGYPTFQQPSSFYPGYPPGPTYKSESTAYPPPQSTAYPPPSNAYPPPPSNVYPPPSSYYPPAAYPPSPFGTTASPSTYPPPVAYPPPYPAQPYQGYYPGTYPPHGKGSGNICHKYLKIRNVSSIKGRQLEKSRRYIIYIAMEEISSVY